MELFMDFAKNLRLLRKQAGLTQEQMAEKLHISETQYGNYEQGKSTPPLDKFVEIAMALNLPLDYFVKERSRIFKNHTAAVFFDELIEMDDEKLDMLFELLHKLRDFKYGK